MLSPFLIVFLLPRDAMPGYDNRHASVLGHQPCLYYLINFQLDKTFGLQQLA